MDRHDLPGVSAADVAEAHAKDLEIQDTHGVKFLSYWFDEESGSAFCLARASAAEELENVHRESHGLIPNEVIPVSENAVLQFLGKVHDPADQSEVRSAFRAVLFTDLVDSTALGGELGSGAFLELLGRHDLMVRRALVASRGREVKHTGDGIMASFDEVTGALECAWAVRAGFRAAEESSPSHLRVRIGVAAGEPVDRDGDLFGPTVNLANRLCSAAEPNRVLVSDVVHDLGAVSGFSFADTGRRTFKGFTTPVPTFELVGAPETVTAVQGGR